MQKIKFPKLIAEVANCHGGDKKYMLKMTNELCRSDANAIKFQLIIPDEFIAKGHSMYPVFEDLQFGLSVWKQVSHMVKKSGKMLAFDVYGHGSVSLAKKLKADLIKIHAMDTDNIGLIKTAIALNVPVIISTGGATLSEIDNIMKNAGKDNICLMVGFQSFPTPSEESNLNRIKYLKKRYGCRVGYMDHVSGTDKFAYVLPCLAKAFGADIIEKHVYLPAEKTKYDWQSALSPSQITELSGLLKTTSLVCGHSAYILSGLEKEYRKKYRRCAVINIDKVSGDAINAGDVDFLRAEFPSDIKPFYREDMNKIVGRRLKKELKKGGIILRGNIK